MSPVDFTTLGLPVARDSAGMAASIFSKPRALMTLNWLKV
jgi:hypothetical protein